MHRSLTEVISAEGDGMLSKPVLQSITKLLMPGFLSSYFVLRAILVIYVGGGYYASINLADFDIPTKYEELKSVIEISRILLQVKVSSIFGVLLKYDLRLHALFFFCRNYYPLLLLDLNLLKKELRRKNLLPEE